MKLSLLLPALLLPITASASLFGGGRGHDSGGDDFAGDFIELDIISSNSDFDQFRIITKPRTSYDPSTDKLEVYKKYGSCVDSHEIMDGDDAPKVSNDCCWKFKEFSIWPEKQSLEVGSEYTLDYKYDGDGQCSKITRSQNPVTVGPGTYNSYMVQVSSENWWSTDYERVIRFPKKDSDKIFAFWETEWVSVYNNVASDPRRATGIFFLGSSFEINCPSYHFSPSDNCPVLSQGGSSGGAPSPIVDGK
eukprot:scaffold11201_cov151-Cylindrotheca_fusiformis.AAC.1